MQSNNKLCETYLGEHGGSPLQCEATTNYVKPIWANKEVRPYNAMQ